MAKQTFTTGQVLTAAQMTSLQQTAMLGGAASAKTASYTLVAADAGTAISMSNAGATTITVNTALFAAGDTVQITNLGAGVCTITAGTATVNTSASLALAQYESGTLNFTSTSAAIFIKGAGAAAASGGMTLISTTSLSGASVTLSSIPQTYKSLYLVLSGVTTSSGNGGFRVLPNNVSNLSDQSMVRGGVATDLGAGTIRLDGGADHLGSNANNVWAVTINDYTSSTAFKAYNLYGFWVVPAPADKTIIGGGAFRSTTAITSLVIDHEGNTMNAGTVLLYGVS